MAGDSVEPLTAAREAWLVYDGDCPFCRRYVRYVRLRESLPGLRMINAREGGGAVDEARAAGYDLDEGMVLRLDDRWYHGADCIHVLALLSTRTGLFNRLNAMIFRSATLSRWLYPWLRAGRNATLRLLQRDKLGPDAA